MFGGLKIGDLTFEVEAFFPGVGKGSGDGTDFFLKGVDLGLFGLEFGLEGLLGIVQEGGEG